jgi:N-acetyl-alpha-D-muramate 1-phosphate uridylyltransferase
MTGYRNEDKWDKSNVWFEAGAVRCYDKKLHLPQMRHIDWGLSVAKAELFAREPAGRSFDLTETLGSLSKTGELAGFEVSTRFYEIGSIEGLHEIDALLRRQN